MSQQYHDNIEAVKSGKPANLPEDTPFKVNDNALTVIGHAKAVLKFLSYCIPIEDTFHIINYQGNVVGSVSVCLNILWTPEQAAQVDGEDFEGLRDINNLKTLDIEISIPSCQGLPVKYASDVRCQFCIPDFVTNVLLPEDGSEVKASGDELEEMLQRGGSYSTPFNPDTEGQLIVNPSIGYRRVLRIYDVSEKVIRWLEENELVVTVKGEMPDKFKGNAAPAPTQASASGGDDKLVEMQRALQVAEAARQRAEDEAKQHAAAAQRAEMQSRAQMEVAQQQPAAAPQQDDAAARQLAAAQAELKKQQDEMKKLQAQNQALQSQKKSSACSVL
jgi:hypothetical protein